MAGMTQAVNALGLRIAVVAGTNATTQTLTGIETEDTLVFSGHFTPGATATFADITSNTTITDTDEITFAADYSSDNAVVVWQDSSAIHSVAQHISSPRLGFILVDGSNATTATATGIAVGDTIISATLFETKAAIAAVSDITTDVTITATDEVTFGSDYSSDQVLVVFHNASGAGTTQHYSDMALQCQIITGHASATAVTGMTAGDVILFAGEFTAAADINTLADKTSLCTAGAAQVEFSSTTASNTLWLWWIDTSL